MRPCKYGCDYDPFGCKGHCNVFTVLPRSQAEANARREAHENAARQAVQNEGLEYWMQRALLAEQQARHAERYAKRVEKLQHDLARKERYIAAVDLACEMNRNMVAHLTVKLVRAKILLNARY